MTNILSLNRQKTAKAMAKASMVWPEGNDELPASDNFIISGQVIKGRSLENSIFKEKLIVAEIKKTESNLKKMSLNLFDFQ